MVVFSYFLCSKHLILEGYFSFGNASSSAQNMKYTCESTAVVLWVLLRDVYGVDVRNRVFEILASYEIFCAP